MAKEAMNIIKGTEHPEEFNPDYKEALEKITGILIDLRAKSSYYPNSLQKLSADDYVRQTRSFSLQILSLKVGSLRLAIVDDEAELPKFDFEKHLIAYNDYIFIQDELLEAGYVKEIKP